MDEETRCWDTEGCCRGRALLLSAHCCRLLSLFIPHLLFNHYSHSLLPLYFLLSLLIPCLFFLFFLGIRYFWCVFFLFDPWGRDGWASQCQLVWRNCVFWYEKQTYWSINLWEKNIHQIVIVILFYSFNHFFYDWMRTNQLFLMFIHVQVSLFMKLRNTTQLL